MIDIRQKFSFLGRCIFSASQAISKSVAINSRIQWKEFGSQNDIILLKESLKSLEEARTEVDKAIKEAKTLLESDISERVNIAGAVDAGVPFFESYQQQQQLSQSVYGSTKLLLNAWQLVRGLSVLGAQQINQAHFLKVRKCLIEAKKNTAIALQLTDQALSEVPHSDLIYSKDDNYGKES